VRVLAVVMWGELDIARVGRRSWCSSAERASMMPGGVA
jgi:hypothetical protein